MDECNENASDDEQYIMKMTWKRFEKQHFTNGYREGALTGKNGQYQQSFNSGYADGFQSSHDEAMKLGENRIKIFIQNKQTNHQFDVELQKLMRDLCKTCSKKIKEVHVHSNNKI